MLKFLKRLFSGHLPIFTKIRPITIKYTRIRKPRKDEFMVFMLPGATVEEVIRFERAFDAANKNDKRYLVCNTIFRFEKLRKYKKRR